MRPGRINPKDHEKAGHRCCWPPGPGTGGKTDKGRGHIRCKICGEPVADHAIGPCPQATYKITLQAVSSRTLYRRQRRLKGLS